MVCAEKERRQRRASHEMGAGALPVFLEWEGGGNKASMRASMDASMQRRDWGPFLYFDGPQSDPATVIESVSGSVPHRNLFVVNRRYTWRRVGAAKRQGRYVCDGVVTLPADFYSLKTDMRSVSVTAFIFSSRIVKKRRPPGGLGCSKIVLLS